MTTTPVYHLAAFDPGERTGFIVARVGDLGRFVRPEELTRVAFHIQQQGVLTVRDVGHQLADILRDVDHVVYETWRLYEDYALAMIGNDMQPSQVVGMIRYEAWKQQKRIHNQGATVKKPAVKTMPQWLKNHMSRSSEQHDQDAIMHGWFFALQRHYAQTR